MSKSEAARVIMQMWMWALERYFETRETEFLFYLSPNNEGLSGGYLRLHISIDHISQKPRWIATMLDISAIPYDKYHMRADYVPTAPEQGIDRASGWIEHCGVYVPSNWMETALTGSEATEFYQSLLRLPETDGAA